jgi:5'-nucleotidase
MNRHRRSFLKQSSLITGSLLFTSPFNTLKSLTNYRGSTIDFTQTISVLHTNDLHNCIEPLSTGSLKGYGGLKNIAASLSEIPHENLLLDAGDFLDDTLHEADHRKMIDYMNRCQYQVATIGNRELSNGQDYLANLLPLMKFRLVNCNYSFSQSYLKQQVLPYHIIKKDSYKIGITGVGVNTSELKNNNGIVWHHPYDKANQVARYMKNQLNCDLVICLSHLGLIQTDGIPHNLEFAKLSSDIDLIISGHNDEIMPEVKVLRNRDKNEVIISHAASHGLLMKQFSFGFNAKKEKNSLSFRNFLPGLESGASASARIREIKT